MVSKHFLPFVLGALAATGACSISAAAGDELLWDTTVGQPGMNSAVRAMTVFDEGSGDALFAAGWFTTAGGQMVNHIARWDGLQWSPLGSGVNNWVLCVAVFDDGTGPALYAGGLFTTAGGQTANRVAKWDGSQWSPLGEGVNNGVLTLAVFDDGMGPALYAGGFFTAAGGQPASRIAKWDGSQWSPLGKGMSNTVEAITVFDDGAGPALYAAGSFTAAGGQPANRIAKWDGTQWLPLGEGLNGTGRAFHVFDDGSGQALYVGGNFTTADGQPANSIAKWDGSQWSPLGTGMNGEVASFTVFDDGAGPALYAGGAFTTAGVKPARRIAKWDGSQWSILVSGMNEPVRALISFDDGGGAALFAGGEFSLIGGQPTSHIAAWRRDCPPPAVSLHVPKDYPTIQTAIDAAEDGTEIIVAPGTYNETINYLGKTIRLRSSGGAEVTVIDAQGDGTVVTCASGEGSCTLLEGFTITGGAGTVIGSGTHGGGILVDGGTLRIRHCIIADNHVTIVGGGIYGASGVLYVSDTRIEGNSAGNGGGVKLRNVYADIVRCHIEANAAIGDPPCQGAGGIGGGLFRKGNFSTGAGWVHVVECIFERNTATDAGGAVCTAWPFDEPARLDNCRFVANTAPYGGGVANGTASPPLIVTNSIFHGNAATGTGCGGKFGGAAASVNGPIHLTGCAFLKNTAVQGGSVNTAALGGALQINGLVESCTFENNIADGGGAIHAVWNSPGIRNSFFCGNDPNHIAGDSWSDLGGNEFHDTCIPDLNGDGVVDVQDLLILLAAWGLCADCIDCPADLNGDCSVDALDLLILLANWG